MSSQVRPAAALSTLLCATFGIATPAVAASPALDEFEALARASAQTTDPAQGIARAAVLTRLRTSVPTHKAAEILQASAEQAKHPQVRVVLERLLSDVRVDLGGAREDLATQHGCLTNFEVVGPFENPSMEAFDSQLPPEYGETGPYDGKLDGMTWRALPDRSNKCLLNVSRSVQPATDAVAYLATTIDNPTDKRLDAQLMLGVQGSYKVWVNGALVAARQRDDGIALDSDAWSVTLKPGANDMLIKLASSQDSGFDAIARLVDASFAPMTQVTHEAAWGKTRTAASPRPPRQNGSGLLERAKRAAAASPPDDALWGAWLWRATAYKDPSTPWRGVAERLDAGARDTLTPKNMVLLAELFEEHWKKLEVLEHARSRAPRDPWVLYALADELGGSIAEVQRMQERALLEELVAAHPGFADGHAARASWYDARGFDRRALALLEAAKTDELLATPTFATRLVGARQSTGRRSQADALREQVRAIAAYSSGYAWRDISEQIAAQRYDDALPLIRAQQALSPWSDVWYEKEVEVLRAMGRADEALSKLDQLISRTPGDVDLRRAKADLLAERGDPASAVVVLREALEYRPQDAELRDLIAHLTPESDPFHEPWMFDVAQLRQLSEQTDPGTFHVTTLVDQQIVQVSKNGLAQTVTQVVERVNSSEGVRGARTQSVYFQTGDERVDVLRVRVYKADGSLSEDYDTWLNDGARKGSTTYNDSGTVTIRANDVEPGDLVEIQTRLSQIANRNFRGDYFGDIAYLQGSNPIARARYAVVYPKQWDLYFRPPASEHTRTETMPDGTSPAEDTKVTAFDVTNIPDVKTDSDQPGATDVYDYILVSNKKTYDEVGQWWWNLVEEQLIVDDTIRAKVDELTKGLKTDEARVRTIYDYVVKNTRYLHVGLGIHGWKPYRTTTCFRRRYGDCKDKASLLKVMLEAAGVQANLVLVRTRRLGRVDDAPASMHVFNHAITYVPSMDLYLDGTAEFNGTRELTSMDQGAQALVVMDGGATKWVTLPIDAPDTNLMVREFAVDFTGSTPRATGKIVAHGANAVYYRTTLEDSERRDEVFGKQLASMFSGAELISATYSDMSKLEQPVTITFTFEGGDMLRGEGARKYLYPLGAQKNLLAAYAKQATRNQDLMIRVPFANQTTMRYTLPADRAFGEKPRGKRVESEFGSLTIDYQREGDALVARVRYSIDVQRIEVEQYLAFREFLSEVDAALNETIDVREEK